MPGEAGFYLWTKEPTAIFRLLVRLVLWLTNVFLFHRCLFYVSGVTVCCWADDRVFFLV